MHWENQKIHVTCSGTKPAIKVLPVVCNLLRVALTLSIMPFRCTHVVVCINSSLLSIDEYYFTVCL